MAIGPDGSLYFSHQYDHVIYRLDPDSNLTIVAGIKNGIVPPWEYHKDNVPANTTYLGFPEQIALDKQGALFSRTAIITAFEKWTGTASSQRLPE